MLVVYFNGNLCQQAGRFISASFVCMWSLFTVVFMALKLLLRKVLYSCSDYWVFVLRDFCYPRVLSHFSALSQSLQHRKSLENIGCWEGGWAGVKDCRAVNLTGRCEGCAESMSYLMRWLWMFPCLQNLEMLCMRTRDTSNENTEREGLLETEHRGRELSYETTQQLGALDALPEVLGSVPSTHVRCFTNVCDSSSRCMMPFTCCGHLCHSGMHPTHK